jgi:AcrR family transcriptional regulator
MQKRGVTTKEKILVEAELLFAHTGYDSTGVAEICQAAKISKGAFYHHFPSKHAVFLELLEKWLSVLDVEMEGIRKKSEDVPQGLIAMTAMVSKVLSAGRGRLPMFLEYWLQSSRDPEIWKETVAPYRRYQQLFAEIIREGIKEGSIENIDPDIVAKTIVSLALGIILQGLLDPEGTAWDEVALKSMKIIMTGLERKAV